MWLSGKFFPGTNPVKPAPRRGDLPLPRPCGMGLRRSRCMAVGVVVYWLTNGFGISQDIPLSEKPDIWLVVWNM